MTATAKPRRWALFALGIALVLASAGARVEDLVLVKVERQQPPAVAPTILDEASGVLELESGWLATVPRTLLRRLQSAGVALSVLDETPAGRHHFLVFGDPASDRPTLEAAGRLVPIEPGVSLLAATNDQLRPKVPGRFAIAPLSLSPPSLLRPTFDIAGRPRAVPRSQAAAALAAPDAMLAAAVADVSVDHLSDIIKRLESYETRYATTTNLAAAGNYLFDQFRRLGLQVEYDDFTFTTANHAATNIIATIPGRASPNDLVILCAHYDSFSDQRPAVAPGADDNASGTAALLEAARVLAGLPFDFTVRLIAFSAEEWGLYGSRHYAEQARARGERIVGVINLDMIGYADQLPEDLQVFANPASEWLADRFRAAAGTYTSLPSTKTVNATVRSSDHAPFWDNAYSAVMCIEDSPLRNPHYHRATDRFDTLTMSFVEAVTRAAVAAVGDIAQTGGALPTPTGLTVETFGYRAVFSRAKRSVLRWNPVLGSIGYSVYRANTSHGTYRRLNTVPTQPPFTDEFLPVSGSAFYVVTAVDRQGRESNYSAEVEAR